MTASNPVGPLFLYSDASYSHTHGIGIAGFLLFTSVAENESGSVYRSQMMTLTESNNIRAELRAALLALDTIAAENIACSQLHLITDCKTIADLPGRRKNLEAREFTSQRTGLSLANSDLYRTFYSIFDQLLPQLRWIKGHSPKNSNDPSQRNFRALDQMVRKELRIRVNERAGVMSAAEPEVRPSQPSEIKAEETQ